VGYNKKITYSLLFMRKFIKNWLPVFLWASLIFYLSSQPGLKSGFPWPYDFILRKLAHITEYAILFLLIIRAFKNYNLSIKKALFWAFILTILYALSDEYHQAFVAERVSSLTDLSFDSFGVLLLTWWQIRRFY